MLKLLRFKVKLGFIVNPFYLYVIAFSLSIIVYLFGWSSLFPKLSFGLIIFFAVTFILFLITGYLCFKKKQPVSPRLIPGPYLNDLVFGLALIEAIQQKIPVICSDVAVFRELFHEDEVTFFKSEDLPSLVSALSTAEETGKSKTDLAFTRYLNNYTDNLMTKSYSTLYQSAIC